MTYKGPERRQLLALRRLIDTAEPVQGAAMKWMARKMGPEGLAELEKELRSPAGMLTKMLEERFQGMRSFEDFILNSFPPRWRAVIEMRSRGQSREKIAEHLGTSLKNVTRYERQAARQCERVLNGCRPLSRETFEKYRWLFERIGVGLPPQRYYYYDESCHEIRARDAELLHTRLEELELSVRAFNCLRRSGIRTVGELVARTESELLRNSWFGRKSLREVKEILARMGLSLGMQIVMLGAVEAT